MARSPSVVHLTRSAWPVPGGMEASIEGLARAQVAAGWDVTVLGLRGAQSDVHGVRRRLLERVGPRRYPFARGLGPWLERADVVHVHGLDGLLDQVVGRHPAVGVSTHGGYFHTPRHAAAKRWVLRGWTRRSLARAGAVWFSSASDQAQIGAGVAGQVLGDGVDPPSGSRAPVPGRWLVPGRVDVHKGLDDLLALIRHPAIRARLGELRVVGPEARQGGIRALRRRARGLPVCFTGWVDAPTWSVELACAEVAVFPSRHEGFGIAAVEAMAGGVPVVLSDIPAFREHLGETGVDVRGGDVSGFLRALDRAPSLADARRAGSARHRWSEVCARYLVAYRALLAGR